MDFRSKNEVESKRRQLNIIFLGVILTDVIIGIITMYMLSSYLEIIFRLTFEIYIIIEKKLLYLLAFCIANLVVIIINFIDLMSILEKEGFLTFLTTKDSFAVSSMIFFDILIIILLIIIWKNKYWDVILHTKISLPKNLKISFIIYCVYTFLLHITLYIIALFYHTISIKTSTIMPRDIGAIGIRAIPLILPSIVLAYSPKVIAKELRIYMFFIYIAFIGQGFLMFYAHDFEFNIRILIILPFLILLFINAILCHLNFGKNLKFYLTFDPDLGKEYEYSNDLNSDDDDDDDNEEEKDEKVFETLKRHWKTGKSFIIHKLI